MPIQLHYHATATCDDCGTVETCLKDPADCTPERFAVYTAEHFEALGWIDSFRVLCPACRERARQGGYAPPVKAELSVTDCTNKELLDMLCEVTGSLMSVTVGVKNEHSEFRQARIDKAVALIERVTGKPIGVPKTAE